MEIGEEKERGGKEEKKKKGMERVCAKEKEKGRMICGRKEEREEERMKEKEKEKKKRGRERRIENRESGIRSVTPSPDVFPSVKLGNNMTPIKGRLGKNTTPNSRGPTKLNQNLQADPRRRRSSFDVSFRANFSYTPEGAKYPKYKLHSDEASIYKKDKSTRELVKSFPILHEPALKALASFQELKVRRQREAV